MGALMIFFGLILAMAVLAAFVGVVVYNQFRPSLS